MNKIIILTVAGVIALTSGCVKKYIEVTKTTSGFHKPTDANLVKIVKSKPTREYEELGSVLTAGWEVPQSNSMYNGLRTKAAQIGADAVYIQSEGVSIDPNGASRRWAEGIAIKFKE